MKTKIFTLFLCVAMLISCTACQSSPQVGEYANQQQFLEDMAAGINERCALVDSASYEELLHCELDKIEKYENLTFEDPLFNDLAHGYIDACQLQLIHAENARNTTLSSLWNSGASARYTIIEEFYSRYGLPITEEIAANYIGGTTQNITITTTPSPSDLEEEIDYTDCVEINNLGQWDSSGSYTYCVAEVTNVSADVALNVDLSIVFYDSNGNAIGSSSKTLYGLGKGDTFMIWGINDNPVPCASVSYQITDVSEALAFYSDRSELEFKDSRVGDKIIVEVTNNSDYTYDSGTIGCVFFNGKNPVGQDEWRISGELKPGTTQVAELSTYADQYTDYRLYFNFLVYN